MAQINAKLLAVNAVAGLVILAGAGALMQQVLVPETTAACSTRYPAVTRLAYERAPGQMLSMPEFQSRIGNREWGILENSVIIRDADLADGLALKIGMRKGSWGEAKEDSPAGGVGFRWIPSTVRGVGSACLKYQVRLPEDFDYNNGGRLPGLFGVSEDGQQRAFSASFVWRSGGRAEVEGQTEGGKAGRTLSGKAFEIPRGRWVALEQEIVLNSPGSDDGILRVWVDGSLKDERSNIAWRKSDKITVEGVDAQVYYDGRTALAAAPRDTSVKISPFAIFSN